ncbi:hypothetical protein Poli38472_010422 [Pythium oligandrum]|uniref:Short-chain dehydrogenase/reductase 3 n=1 Tax=Pythium oligandrum TaxID=41045 RepID=A0A8K1C315_PYTOL|nr:hypothetical protein Poli38472_010422 [Pythium oligandrum]|eukprot:TMW55540.1 hypothetical protein Poli38472_010422 [Pythium oligandrum]
MLWLFQRQKSVKGDVVLVTGGGMGIGRLLALKFARLGAVVIVWDLNQEIGDKVVAEIEALGGKAKAYKVDVTNRAMVYSTAEQVIEAFGGVDILINNAGIVDGNAFLECKDSMIERTMSVNATAHFWTIKAFLPGMLKRNKGHLVSIASAAGIFGCGGMVDYSASKYAAVGLMTSLRQEVHAMGKNGIHFTTVCPSFIKTGMFEGVKPPLLTTWLSPEYVAEMSVRAIRRNQGRLMMPSILYVLELLIYLLPDWMSMFLTKFLGVANSMKSFKQTRPHALIKDDDKTE